MLGVQNLKKIINKTSPLIYNCRLISGTLNIEIENPGFVIFLVIGLLL